MFIPMRVATAISIAALIVAIAALVAVYQSVINVGSALASVAESVNKLVNRLSTVGDTISDIGRRIDELNKSVSGLRMRVLVVGPVIEVERLYARHFRLYRDGAVYVVRDGAGRLLVLYPRNVSRALVDAYVEKWGAVDAIPIPVKSIVVMSSTHVGMLYRLWLEGVPTLAALRGVMWGRVYRWYIPEIREMLDNGTIVDVGSATDPDYELIKSLKPDVVIVYTGTPSSDKVARQLDRLGIPYIVVNEWWEPSGWLGRFEWIKVLGALFNAEEVAEKVFDNVVENVTTYIGLARDAEYRPKVAWLIIWGGRVYPAGEQVRQLIRDLGGRWAYAGYAKVDREVLAAVKDVDVFIWSGYLVNSTKDITRIEPLLADLKAFREGRVYALSPSFWQLAHVWPEKIYSELLAIIHPELHNEALTLFRHLG